MINRKNLLCYCTFSILDGDSPRDTLYDVRISQLSRFAKASSQVGDSNNRKKKK